MLSRTPFIKRTIFSASVGHFLLYLKNFLFSERAFSWLLNSWKNIVKAANLNAQNCFLVQSCITLQVLLSPQKYTALQITFLFGLRMQCCRCSYVSTVCRMLSFIYSKRLKVYTSYSALQGLYAWVLSNFTCMRLCFK